MSGRESFSTQYHIDNMACYLITLYFRRSPTWEITDQGAQAFEVFNSGASIQLFNNLAFIGVDIEGTTYTWSDDDYMGFVFSYQV